MTDEAILAGFKSLHEAMADGFDRVGKRFDELEQRLSGRMDRRFTGLEQRMMRRFDERDTRLDDHERRITVLEAKS
jgi:hypothetical protein